MYQFENKNIMMIAPKFYDYHQEIIKSIESMGANVTFFPEEIHNPIYRVLARVVPALARVWKNIYLKKIFANAASSFYDIVFVIRGGVLSPSAMEELRLKLPNAKFVMYQWDSMRQSQYESIIKYFDVIKTFDREDSKKYRLEYQPLFYAQKYKDAAKNKNKKKYDLVFYGAFHSDRLEIVKYFDNFCKANTLVFKYHLYITRLALIRFLLSGYLGIADLKYLKTSTVGAEELLSVYQESFAVLDVELNIQSGITMRTFEALGSGLKLITTNTQVQKEHFYNSENIYILDRTNLNVDLNFFRSNFCYQESFERYEFSNWLNSLFREI